MLLQDTGYMVNPYNRPYTIFLYLVDILDCLFVLFGFRLGGPCSVTDVPK